MELFSFHLFKSTNLVMHSKPLGLVSDVMKTYQAREQEFFSAGEVSWNYGIFIHMQEKKAPPGKKSPTFYAWKLLKIAF